MADLRKRHPGNAPGPWFVDTTCIDCDTCVQCAPGVFAHARDQVVVARPPADDAERIAATRALLACPVGAVGGEPVDEARTLFPQHLGDTARAKIFYCGYNAEDAYGGNAYVVARAGGNLMIDAPRHTAALARAIAALGGLAHVLLTHQDDVADARRWARDSGARVWIHEDDRRAAPFATDLLRGLAPAEVAPGVIAIPTPGHTRGSAMFLVDDDALFTGDSLYWSRALGRLSAFPDACWYSWDEQARSLARLAEAHTFGWILAGHGDRRRLDAQAANAQVRALVARMRDDPDGEGDW